MFSWFNSRKKQSDKVEKPKRANDEPEVYEPHPMNVDGPFYVGDGCCTLCDLPRTDAPDMFRVTEEQDNCYVYKQPETEDELNRMIGALAAAETACIRCRSKDPTLLERLRAIGEEDPCDF